MDWKSRPSSRIRAIGRSDVADILKLSERPEIISFAGGLPDPDTFLVDEIARVAAEVLTDTGRAALGYGPTPGITPMREWLAERMTGWGRPTRVAETLVTTGGIAALDLLAGVLVDPGDVVVVGEPAYLAALHVFRSYRSQFAGVEVDQLGMVPDSLETALAELQHRGVKPALIYTVPSFQNPSGATLPGDRRRQLVDIAARFGVPIVADEAYRDLRFEGTSPPLLSALDPDNAIHINTFSKFFNPGMRLGWITAPAALIEPLIVAKQTQDQCSSTLGQYMCRAFARHGFVDRQIARAIEIYTRKRDAMVRALRTHMPPGVTFTRPEGGFYVWLTLPPGIDSGALLDTAINRENVAYVPGPSFFHHSEGQRHLRLCYSYVAETTIDEGIARLAGLLGHALDNL